jgi:hypothetical protein
MRRLVLAFVVGFWWFFRGRSIRHERYRARAAALFALVAVTPEAPVASEAPAAPEAAPGG